MHPRACNSHVRQHKRSLKRKGTMCTHKYWHLRTSIQMQIQVMLCVCVCVCVHLYWFMNSPTSSCEYQASALTEPQNPRGCVQLCQFNACRTRPENTHTYTQTYNTYNTYLPLHRLMMSATGSVCHSRRQSVTTSTTAIKSTATITRAELLFTAR